MLIFFAPLQLPVCMILYVLLTLHVYFVHKTMCMILNVLLSLHVNFVHKTTFAGVVGDFVCTAKNIASLIPIFSLI